MPVWFDVTSLFSWNRPVTGVTRVELECARGLLKSKDHKVRFVVFETRSKQFIACDQSALSDRIAYLDRLEGHPSGRLRTFLKALLAILPDRTQTFLLNVLGLPGRSFTYIRARLRGGPVTRHTGSVFQEGDCFVTVGFDLSSEQFKRLSVHRQRIQLRVVSCCHDLIPWVRPDLTLDRIARPFLRYLDQLVEISDHVVCNSTCTARDLGRYLQTKSHVPSLSVIRLGSRIGQTQLASPSMAITSIIDRPFILYVSTIERRKNHEILLDAYHGLLSQGVTQLPMMVLVGMRGWGAERFFQKLEAEPDVARYVTLLHHVSDNDLAVLYQKSLFTLYPSLYEGWGLPVAESLAYGKVCIASDAASVPEVGGDLVRYCSPEDASAWGLAIHDFVSHPERVAAKEKKIRKAYDPPEWSETVAQIMEVAIPPSEDVA